MPLITLTVLQAQAAEVIIGQIIDAVARYQAVKTYSDEQCQVLIDAAKVHKSGLDERLAGH